MVAVCAVGMGLGGGMVLSACMCPTVPLVGVVFPNNVVFEVERICFLVFFVLLVHMFVFGVGVLVGSMFCIWGSSCMWVCGPAGSWGMFVLLVDMNRTGVRLRICCMFGNVECIAVLCDQNCSICSIAVCLVGVLLGMFCVGCK